MSTIYTGQDLRIRVTITGEDITGAASAEILFAKPDGTNGTWTATVEDAANGIIYYDATPADLDVAGIWALQARVVDANAKVLLGLQRRIDVIAQL